MDMMFCPHCGYKAKFEGCCSRCGHDRVRNLSRGCPAFADRIDKQEARELTSSSEVV